MISIAHSPDSDDYFMFWAILTGKVPFQREELSFIALNTEELNNRACNGDFDISAVSVGTLPYIANNYAVLLHGASIGRNYGPRLISPTINSIEDLAGKRIAIPGKKTTAALVLSLIEPSAKFVEIPIVPYKKVFEELDRGSIDAALLIHEGQFYFDQQKYKKILDIGVWWKQKYNLPLPLGVNVIRRSLEGTIKTELSKAILQSIKYAIDNKQEAIKFLKQISTNNDTPSFSTKKLEHYLDSYANHDSLCLDKESQDAISILCKAAQSLNPALKDKITLEYQP